MHVASGAVAGVLSGSRTRAALLGVVLHAAGDAVPHEDFPSRRFEAACGLTLLGVLALARGPLDPAVLGAAACAAPDLEHVLPGGGESRRRKWFPSHRFESWHREGGVSAPLQLAAAVAIVALLTRRRKEA